MCTLRTTGLRGRRGLLLSQPPNQLFLVFTHTGPHREAAQVPPRGNTTPAFRGALRASRGAGAPSSSQHASGTCRTDLTLELAQTSHSSLHTPRRSDPTPRFFSSKEHFARRSQCCFYPQAVFPNAFSPPSVTPSRPPFPLSLGQHQTANDRHDIKSWA